MRELFFKLWYWYISTVDKKADIIFMNFGYLHSDMNVNLHENDEKNRYSAQLYHKIASVTGLEDKDLLEVGCGRGGGLSYINRYLSPKSVTGIDINKKAIKFCSDYYNEDNNNFFQADALNLPFPDNSFDVLINVESSHRYPDMKQFLNEVKRVLKPGGYFSFTDFRYDYELDELDNQLNDTGMELIEKEFITTNVVQALEQMSSNRSNMVKKFLPRILHKLGNNFAAVKGSPTYHNFDSGKYEYLHYVYKN